MPSRRSSASMSPRLVQAAASRRMRSFSAAVNERLLPGFGLVSTEMLLGGEEASCAADEEVAFGSVRDGTTPCTTPLGMAERSDAARAEPGEDFTDRRWEGLGTVAGPVSALATQISRRTLSHATLAQGAGLFSKVAEYIPVAGKGLKIGADVVSAAAATIADPPSIGKQRQKIREALRGIDQRVLVLVDDIDRLSRDEVREIVKLVRLTGDFPGIVYLLAFDRERVERALGDDDESGRAYLEKIVQVVYDVPRAQEADIHRLLFGDLDAALSGLEHGDFDQRQWASIFAHIVQPLVRSPRDVRRYVNAIPATVKVVGREVALMDVLALEAIRVFVPDLFSRLPAHLAGLTTGPLTWGSGSDPHADEIRALAKHAAYPEVATAMINELFPLARRHLGGLTYGDDFLPRWRRQRRVAVTEVLRFYLERRLPEGAIATAEVDEAFRLLGDRSGLTSFLEKLSPERIETLLGRLEAYEEEFTLSQVESAAAALLDQMHRLRVSKLHIFDLGADLALHRVILRLLRRVEDENQRIELVSSLLPTLRWWSGMRSIVAIMEGHKLAPLEVVEQWRRDFTALVLEGDMGHLLAERSLGQLLMDAVKVGGGVSVRRSEPLAGFRPSWRATKLPPCARGRVGLSGQRSSGRSSARGSRTWSSVPSEDWRCEVSAVGCIG
jgi:hypothetical protein